MMKKFTITVFLLSAALSAFAQGRGQGSWTERSPYEVTLGVNAGVRDFLYGEYTFGPGDENLITTNTLQAPSLNLGFTYKLNKRVTLGAIATYAQSNYVKSAIYDNSIVRQDNYSYVSLAPRIRLDWYNGEYVTLYSSFALGVALSSENDKLNSRCEVKSTGYVEATYIGVKVGRALFGFADLSSSSTGFMRVGIGYNFKNRK